MPSRTAPAADRSESFFEPPKGRSPRRKPDVPQSIADPRNNLESSMDAMGQIRPATAIGKSKGSPATFDLGAGQCRGRACPRLLDCFSLCLKTWGSSGQARRRRRSVIQAIETHSDEL